MRETAAPRLLLRRPRPPPPRRLRCSLFSFCRSSFSRRGPPRLPPLPAPPLPPCFPITIGASSAATLCSCTAVQPAGQLAVLFCFMFCDSSQLKCERMSSRGLANRIAGDNWLATSWWCWLRSSGLANLGAEGKTRGVELCNPAGAGNLLHQHPSVSRSRKTMLRLAF